MGCVGTRFCVPATLGRRGGRARRQAEASACAGLVRALADPRDVPPQRVSATTRTPLRRFPSVRVFAAVCENERERLGVGIEGGAIIGGSEVYRSGMRALSHFDVRGGCTDF